MEIKKYILALALMSASVFQISAETVTRKEAQRVAQMFFDAAYGRTMAAPKPVYNGRGLTTDRLFSPFYVFSHPAGGYVVVPAENKAFPILAYSLDSKFDYITADDTLKAAMKRYAREIELVRYDSRIPVEAAGAWRDVRGFVRDVLGKEENRERRLDSAVEYSLPLAGPGNDRDEASLDAEPDEEPFRFYSDFVALAEREAAEKTRAVEEILRPSSPVIDNLGGGHFEVVLPEEVVLARIYNLGGTQVETLTFRDTDRAIVSLDAFPVGFYFLLLNGKSGKPYGFKLFK